MVAPGLCPGLVSALSWAQGPTRHEARFSDAAFRWGPKAPFMARRTALRFHHTSARCAERRRLRNDNRSFRRRQRTCNDPAHSASPRERLLARLRRPGSPTGRVADDPERKPNVYRQYRPPRRTCQARNGRGLPFDSTTRPSLSGRGCRTDDPAAKRSSTAPKRNAPLVRQVGAWAAPGCGGRRGATASDHS